MEGGGFRALVNGLKFVDLRFRIRLFPRGPCSYVKFSRNRRAQITLVPRSNLESLMPKSNEDLLMLTTQNLGPHNPSRT